jgi:hypothetical protein
MFYQGNHISTYKPTCKDYYVAAIFLTTLYFAQFLLLTYITAKNYVEHRGKSTSLENMESESQAGHSGKRSNETVNLTAAVAYLPAVTSIALLEKLDDFSQVIWPTNDQGWTKFGFGQIFAVAAIIGPFTEVVRYLFRQTPHLSGHSPISYLFHAMNFHLRILSSSFRS